MVREDTGTPTVPAYIATALNSLGELDSLERSQIEAHEIHRGKEQEVRLSLALSTIQVTVRFSSAKFPEETTDGNTNSTSTISARN
ncbi:hypothetical protein TNCV_4013051 [Trichonephila clavipes]|nr:hypothetical protein TNCV_4013051 [Trichonephila clavipes]